MNRHEYRVIGMSRSGNHAIINWILAQFPGRSCFLNCTEPKTNPYLSARPLDCGRKVITNYPDFDLQAEQRGRFSDKDLLIYSHEDCFLGPLAHEDFEKNHDAWVGTSLERRDILILRDPFNLFASRLHGEFGWISTATALRIWKQHAREFTGDRRYLQQPRVLINYNRWATDRYYRQLLAEELGLEFSDATFEDVPGAGRGSSFDGRRYHGRAADMRTLERWKHFRNCKDYAAVFDAMTRTLARRIFGDVGYAQEMARRDALAD